MKYIDAEKLIKFKEALADIIVSSQGICTYQDCKDIAEREASLLISTLQQEKPEVELEKEITPSLVENMLCEFGVQSIEDVDSECLADIARHFYELGQRTKYQQDRGEFAKLKAKEWQDGYDKGYKDATDKWLPLISS